MEVDRIDAAILAEELTEIYSTSTPKGWPKPLAKVREGRAIRSSLESTPGSIEEGKQQIAGADAIRLEMLRAIHDVLDLKSACQRVSCVESIIFSVI